MIQFKFAEKESGYESAMIGTSYNFNQPIENMPEVVGRLCKHGGGHSKSLQFINCFVIVTAPRYAWADFDTYRLTVKLSQSTNHTILKDELTIHDFEHGDIEIEYLDYLNKLRQGKEFLRLKRALPEGFLQKRIWNLNYGNIKGILTERTFHRLPIIQEFCVWIKQNVEHPELLPDINIKKIEESIDKKYKKQLELRVTNNISL